MCHCRWSDLRLGSWSQWSCFGYFEILSSWNRCGVPWLSAAFSWASSAHTWDGFCFFCFAWIFFLCGFWWQHFLEGKFLRIFLLLIQQTIRIKGAVLCSFNAFNGAVMAVTIIDVEAACSCQLSFFLFCRQIQYILEIKTEGFVQLWGEQWEGR